MKQHPALTLQLMVTVMLSFLLTNCDKEKATQTNIWYTPNYKSLTEVRAEMVSSAARGLKNPGKIYIFGNYIFLSETNEGIHIIDNSSPTAPKNIAFIPVPGNVDLAVKDNTLYADSYSDLVVLNISNPLAVTAKKFFDNMFPYRNPYYNYRGNSRPANTDSIKVVVGWTRHESTIDYDPDQRYNGPMYFDYLAVANAAQSNSTKTGTGGSMARFTLMNNYMYTVSNSELYAFDISVPQDPHLVKQANIGNWNIETIYPFKDKLFIGSTNGMYIYDVSTPGNPVQQAQFAHARSCDPVIADGNTAFVTLRSGTTCNGFTNQLDVIDVSNVLKPVLIKSYGMTNPHGLGKDGNKLFICDGKDGIKVYDAADVNNAKLIKRITGMESYDVIATNSRALVVAKDGLYQYDYSKIDIRLLSKIGLE
ncbi:hypothetical protein A3860_31655 [Niastella vici]|uniref:LVIVD repeat-containing protein n=1 Tax=Niastella vici TaxID=1703345 RepID=A0A1V9FSZ9_9BACT|nr:hypothetical protein [Niastella vici]OQP61485.1 hypothetical protein A3860_31655 [Niastella vici]